MAKVADEPEPVVAQSEEEKPAVKPTATRPAFAPAQRPAAPVPSRADRALGRRGQPPVRQAAKAR